MNAHAHARARAPAPCTLDAIFQVPIGWISARVQLSSARRSLPVIERGQHVREIRSASAARYQRRPARAARWIRRSTKPSELKDTAVSEAGHVAETAKDEAKPSPQEVKYQAKDLYAQTQRELKDQAKVQQQRVAAGCTRSATNCDSMTANAENPGFGRRPGAPGCRGGSRAPRSWLGDRDPSAVLAEVKSFARRKPGTFIIGAAILGIVAGRLTRALAANASDEHADVDGGSGARGIATGAPGGCRRRRRSCTPHRRPWRRPRSTRSRPLAGASSLREDVGDVRSDSF